MQSNSVRRTRSRYLHSNCLGRGSNPYSPRYRSTARTNRLLDHVCGVDCVIGLLTQTMRLHSRCGVDCITKETVSRHRYTNNTRYNWSRVDAFVDTENILVQVNTFHT